ncbi:MAG: hypothetical protein AAGH89_13550 [Verrucomicrobiota bacterium]
MASLTIYLDSDTLSAVEQAAHRDGSSVSGWARKHLAEAAKDNRGWPDDYFEKIEGFEGTDLMEPAEVKMELDAISLDSSEN